MNEEIVPVILCGGPGTRLWPLSRRARPKQFLKLLGKQSPFQETVLRAHRLDSVHPPLIVTHEEYRFLVLNELRELEVEPGGILLEPESRDTAPAVALAATLVARTRPDALLLILPADHYLKDQVRFAAAIEKGSTEAAQGRIVTFGVTPMQPHTGYGYIRKGAASDVEGVYRVAAFKEKPDGRTATDYLARGDYLWNSGIFLVRADVYLRELERYAPDIAHATVGAVENIKKDGAFLRPDRQIFGFCQSKSLDYAVMERTRVGTVVQLNTEWKDLGSWLNLWEAGNRRSGDNVTHGNVLLGDASGSYVYSSGRLVAAMGLRNQVVVETPDAVLVAPLNREDDGKNFVNALKEQGWKEAEDHLRVYRPWGWYESLESGKNLQIKRIEVNPGASLSLQLHHHRSEHWLVVQGEAEATLGNEVYNLQEDDTLHIPANTPHRLSNKGETPLKIIEIQRGSYLGEDDIVRYEDDYGRLSARQSAKTPEAPTETRCRRRRK